MSSGSWWHPSATPARTLAAPASRFDHDRMITATATAISWIPSEAIEGATRLPFDVGIAHWDPAPPDALGPDATVLTALRDDDRLRFANRVRVDVDFETAPPGSPPPVAVHDESLIGSTTMRVGARAATFAAVALPTLRGEVEHGDGWVRITQTAGGRTGVPAPRRVAHPPFVKISAPLAWSTLALTVRADGTSEVELVGASPFPRHWVYDARGALVAKSGLVDFRTWYRRAFGKHSPWGREDSRALAVAVESALERALSTRIMAGATAPEIRTAPTGHVVMEQGAPGTTLVLVLDGVVRVSRDGEDLVELGPGAVLGERAGLGDGTRTATVVATTRTRIAEIPASTIDLDALEALASTHRREETTHRREETTHRREDAARRSGRR